MVSEKGPVGTLERFDWPGKGQDQGPDPGSGRVLEEAGWKVLNPGQKGPLSGKFAQAE